MKKILLSILALSTLTITSCRKHNTTKVEVIKEKEVFPVLTQENDDSEPQGEEVQPLIALGIYDKEAKITTLTNGTKRVSVIGIHHIGRVSYYKDVRTKVDKFREQGYEFLYELTRYDKNLSAEALKTYLLKARKVVGFPLTDEPMMDEATNSLNGFPLPARPKLINQPDYKFLGISVKNDINADLPKNVLVDKFEEKHGKIQLSECDLNTDIKSDYQCSQPHEDFNYLVYDVRNQEVIKHILNSKNDKIAIVYGSKHIDQFLELLQKHDSRWRKLTN